MKKLLIALTMLISVNAFSLEVGEEAKCVVLDHVQTDNTVTSHCIREKEEGRKFTLIEFFSITCSACQENLPKISSLANELSDVATTRFVSIDRDINAVKNYINQKREFISFEVALDNDRFARKEYQVFATPTLFILNENNQVVYKHVGVLSQTDLENIRNLTRGL